MRSCLEEVFQQMLSAREFTSFFLYGCSYDKLSFHEPFVHTSLAVVGPTAMSQTQEVRPWTNIRDKWRSRSRLRASRSEKKVSDISQHSQHDDSRASVQSVQLTPVRPPTKKNAVVAWISAHWIVVIYSAISLALLVLLVYLSFFAASMDDGSTPDFLSCRSWGFGTSCGLWGVDCLPFESEWTAFRCPTRCTLDQSSSMAVFGSGPYRADSRICRAAAHAGVVSSNGGCAFYRFAGAANAFYASSTNGVATKEFLSWFPKTIEFKEASSSYCTDLSWWILAVGVITIAGFGLLPRIQPTVMFYVLIVWGFFYTRLIGQPSSQNYAGIAINSYGEVMVLLAASSVAHRLAAITTFRGWKLLTLKRRTVMWVLCYVLPFHILINMNFIGYIPWLNVDLGGYEELEVNAGTYVVFTLVGIVVAVLAISLLRGLYRSGNWKKYIMMYSTVIAMVLVSWGLFPSTSLHLHHTMLGALIIPITAFPTAAAAISQSAALGLFIQGYARWGWHSYLDTIPTYLTIAVPENPPNITNVTPSGVTVVWEPLDSVQAYSLRLNRVEVYRGLDTSKTFSNLQSNMTYFVTVAGVAGWGTDGRLGPESNFTTLEA